uniref:Uncharacterized protein n=1 Tax=Aegilops tauschii subsp. strangulata TaxID=200361 RepID=A0A452XZH8_AEGTS
MPLVGISYVTMESVLELYILIALESSLLLQKKKKNKRRKEKKKEKEKRKKKKRKRKEKDFKKRE